jgi:TnpA family transposase
MSQFHILHYHEIEKFKQPPRFSKDERMKVFVLDLQINNLLKGLKRSDENKVGFLLQLGYYKTTNKFFRAEYFKSADIYYVSQLLNVNVSPKSMKLNYKDRTRTEHTKKVLDCLGHEPYLHYEDLIEENVVEMVEKQQHPKQIMFSIIDLLREKRISIPSYDYFCKVLTDHFRDFEKSLLDKLESLLSGQQCQAFDDLLDEGKPFEHSLLTKLKTINQSVQPVNIKVSIQYFLILKRLYQELKDVIDQLGISTEAINFYAGWVKKAQTRTQIQEIMNENRQRLYLLSFIIFQHRHYEDTLLDIHQKCVGQYIKQIEKEVDQTKLQDADEKDSLGESVINGYQSKAETIKNARQVIHEPSIENDKKIDILKFIIPETQTKQETESDQAVEQLQEELSDAIKQAKRFNIMLANASKLHQRVADIVKHLSFTSNDPVLEKAIVYYQTQSKVTKNAPTDHLSKEEYEAVFNNGKFEIQLYKSILFTHIYEGIRSGSISLIHSYKYLPIESYMLDEENWHLHRDHILQRLGLEKFADIEALLTKLKQQLDPTYLRVNENILKRENNYVRFTNGKGKFIINTPPIEKPDYQGLAKLFSEHENIPILNIIRRMDLYTNISSSFRHYKVRNNLIKPSREIFYAGLFALASNMGAYQLSNTSIGINYDKLAHAITWYFTLDNLYEINEMILDFMQKLEVTNLFKKEKNLLHSSSDAKKRIVTAESLNANYSYKYFGQGKGSNVYMFVDERGFFFYSNVFSSAERDAAYVIDGLMHSNSIKVDIHSTDTHGYSEMVFALSHLLGITFAPRIANIQEQVLSYFDYPESLLENTNFRIIPTHPINLSSIKKHWELILRLLASIKTKNFKASTILKRLSTYTKQHALQQAIKEFGKIIKSIFILEYIDNVTLRQDIEKQLNKGELANRFSGVVSFANNQEITQVHREDQEISAMCKLIVQNMIIAWNYIELTKIIMRSQSKEERDKLIKNIKELSIISWQHINMFGLYDFSSLEAGNDSEFDLDQILAFQA